ncbi:MAG TPA: prefoldin subunit alpha [Thermoplasmatales archaeon]|nr:prefoldin subunit alpha [Thermoplasmatales archaeon]
MNEEEYASNVYLLQRYQENMEEIYGETELIGRLISEYERVIETLQEMSGIEEKESLIPIGGNVFVYGSLKDTKNVIVNVGRGVLVEKPVNSAIDTINKKISDLKKSQEKLFKTADEIRLRMEEISQKLRDKDVQVPPKKD